MTKRSTLGLLGLIEVVLLCGCGAQLMKRSENQQATVTPAGKSQVVFMRPSYLGSAVSAVVYDATSDKPEFIGIVSAGAKLPYITESGDHVFMVVSEAADFMKANLDPNKTYYALVTPRFGVWRARFSLKPVCRHRNCEFMMQSEEFETFVKDTELVENTAESRQWAVDNMGDVISKQQEYWPVWQTKSDAEKFQLSLLPGDGI